MSDGLVQNLRSYPHASRSLRDEAADRIEAYEHVVRGLDDRIAELERAVWVMHGEAHEHIKRIESLEAALLEIADHETSSLGGMWYRDRARHTLQAGE